MTSCCVNVSYRTSFVPCLYNSPSEGRLSILMIIFLGIVSPSVIFNILSVINALSCSSTTKYGCRETNGLGGGGLGGGGLGGGGLGGGGFGGGGFGGGGLGGGFGGGGGLGGGGLG